MNKILITSLILFICVKLFAQNEVNKMPLSDAVKSPVFVGQNPHDSLLFDGPGENYSWYQPDDCKIIVDYAVGGVHGAVYETKDVTICGVNEKEKIVVNRDLKLNDQLAFGQTIETKSYSSFWIQLPDGSQIKIRPNSKFVIPPNLCEGQPSQNPFKLLGGKIWRGIKWAVTGGQKFEVETERASWSSRGTEYSLEVKDNEDILKVYEGSVEVKITKSEMKETKDAGKSMEQLNEDYRNGKISQEEFIKKAKEYTEKMTKETTDFKVSVIVEAGNQVTVGDKIGQVIAIEFDDRQADDNLVK